MDNSILKEDYKPTDRNIFFPKGRTALLVIDPVNDFLSEGGAAYEMCEKTLKLHNVVANLEKLITGTRKRNIPVLFGPMAYTQEDYKDKQLHKKSGINRLMYEKKMFLAGSWGADFHPDLQPKEDDIILNPHKTCDVFKTDLPDVLEQLGTTHLVIAGMAANLCCESTARSAMEEGYDVTLLKDAIGASGITEYETAVHVNFPLMSNAVIKVEEFLEIIDDSSLADVTDIKVGDSVMGSDHIKVGTVKQVMPETEETQAYILVPRGLIFKTDTYIPIDAITKIREGKIYLNIPRIVIGEMPWQEPLSRADWKAKQGPLQEEVKQLYGSYSPSNKYT